MRFANHDGRAVLLVSDHDGLDIATASTGKFGPDPHDVLQDWDAFATWAQETPQGPADVAIARERLRSPSPTPRQIIGIGLNYGDHAAESGFERPTDLPPTFTKFTSSLGGPFGQVVLPSGGHTDWEVELVVVIGRPAHRVTEADAWDHVAGLAVGQDLSERISQLRGPAPQFSLGKSYPGFAPVGPWLVTPDEVDDPNDLELGCSLDGEVMQSGRTRDLLFPVAALISGLSDVLTLYPGDLIFTGTPAGVGLGRDPQRFIAPGQTLRSWIAGVGELEQTFVQER